MTLRVIEGNEKAAADAPRGINGLGAIFDGAVFGIRIYRVFAPGPQSEAAAGAPHSSSSNLRTVIASHRRGFRLFWTRKIRHGQPAGRPGIPKDVRQLIRTMSREHPLWSAPRLHGELLKLGSDIGETSVSKYKVRHREPPSQTWRTFLDDHGKSMSAVDFFTVPTVRFQVL